MTNDDKLSLEEAVKQAQKIKIAVSNDQFDDNAGEPKTFETHDAPQPFYESFDLMVKDFNRYFIQTLITNQPYVIWEHDNIITYFTYENFHKQFSYVKVANNLFGEKGKVESNVKPAKYWLESYHKRRALGIKFWPSMRPDPRDPEGKYFNTWKDWVTKPVEDDILCRVARQYLFEVICSKKKSKYSHLLDFLTHMFQFPEIKPTFGLAIKGEEEGTGKSKLSEQLIEMIGLDNSNTTSNPDRIFGDHNGIMNNCIFLNLAEVEWAKYRKYSNMLRDLFTIRVITIDEKCMPPIKQNSFTRIIMDGNAEHIMYVSRTARRLSIYTVNPVHIGDTKYFGEFTDVMNNGGRGALMYFFLNRKIGRFFDPFKPLYTEELDEQKELSLDPVSEFWLEEYLEKNVLPYDEVTVLHGLDGPVVSYKVIVEKLTWCFNDWQKDRGERRQLSPKAFGRQFRKIVPEMPPSHDVKYQPQWLGRQLNCFEIKTLKDCRDFFVAHQRWKKWTWNNATKFEQTYVDHKDWYKER
jgi:hypothetical protein